MAPVPTTGFEQWRSSTVKDEPSPLAQTSPVKPVKQSSPPAGPGKTEHLHPSFLPPCEHGRDGEMHAHAFDLLSLHNSSAFSKRLSQPIQSASTTPAVPSSVPAHTTSFLTASRPPSTATLIPQSTNVPNGGPRPRRMSSTTSGVLGRGKLGATGEGIVGPGGLSKETRPGLPIHAASYAGPTPISNRRLSTTATGTSPSPQLFDFTKTDRRPSNSHTRGLLPTASRAVSSSVIPASLPTGSHLLAQHVHPPPILDEMELDMEFDADEEEDEDDGDGGGSGRSGSAEIDMDMEDDGEIKKGKEWEKLALGTGSGGVKGRRKGMVFKCENCSKEYRHPSCLIKHRWEHSPHWKEPTQLSMSKHQQVQMLEAAAILMHMDPSLAAGRSLPNDKSLWPAVLASPQPQSAAQLRSVRSNAKDLPDIRSPPSSVIAPLTPSSLHQPSILSGMGKERKSSPGSDSTTSSIGAGDVYSGVTSPAMGALGLKQTGSNIGNGFGSNAAGVTSQGRPSRPLGIIDRSRNNGSSSLSSSVPGPGTPHSIGSLPDMSGLHFHSGSIGHGTPGNGFTSASPIIPGRGMPTPLSLGARAGMIGGGMFGKGIKTVVPSSSVRSGAGDDDEEDDNGWGQTENPPVTLGRGLDGGRSSSSEFEEGQKGGAASGSTEGEEWGMEMEMEL